MPPADPWTPDTLEAALRRTLTERARIKVRKLGSNSAEVEWTDNGLAHITLDKLSVGQLRGTIHELMHVVLEPALIGFGDEMQEEAIEAWEEMMSDRIMASPRRKSWWRAAIQGKLPK